MIDVVIPPFNKEKTVTVEAMKRYSLRNNKCIVTNIRKVAVDKLLETADSLFVGGKSNGELQSQAFYDLLCIALFRTKQKYCCLLLIF